MYNLGDHFKVNYDILPDKSNIITGQNYRFTILSDRLIRLEYNEDNVFTDEPTELVINRKFPTVKYETKENDNYLEIKTKYFIFQFNKKSKFIKSVRIDTIDGKNSWRFNHVEAKNYEAPILIENNKLKSIKSLYSLDGFASIDDSKSKIILEDGNFKDREKCIDTYVFVYLNDFNLCLKDYYTLTGFPALIPRFALGNWWSKNEPYNDKSLKNLIDNFEDNEIPLSVLLLDKDWHTRLYDNNKLLHTGFTFNNDLFAYPYEMINYLHSKGIRVGLSINPTEGFYKVDEFYEQANKYLQANENGIIPYNVLDPKWVDVYLKLFIHPLDALGTDFYWIDKKEQDFYLKYYHFNDMNRNYKRRSLVFGYNDLIAQHRYPIMYVGKTKVNWDTLKLIPKFCDLTNIGVNWWSFDVGGYEEGIEDSELYIRFVQLGTFSPILKFGSDEGKYYKREPWRWNIKTLSIVTDYLELRHRMIPYLYSEAYKYHKEGVPIIKPLYYKAPEMIDDLLYRDEYYFGSQLFICPIIKTKDNVINRTVHRFYMPEGTWYDFFNGKKYPGNNNYVGFYREQNYPVFVKSGSIIPLGNNSNINDTTPPKDLEIHFFPGRSNEYSLYEDDGISSLYKKGFYLLTKIDYNYMPSNYTVIIRPIEGKSKIVPDYRNYKLVFRNVKKASKVIVYENRSPIECKSYISGPNFIVELNNISTLSQLTVNCKGEDIEFDATRLINDDIESILDDLSIETLMKEKLDAILFSDLPMNKKRIEIRKLGNKGLDRKFVKLFLRLLEYVSTV